MLKLSVGYQFLEDESFYEIVKRTKEQIEEVYFAYPNFASGRSMLEDEITEPFKEEIEQIRNIGIKLDLLFNANCYGENAISRSLSNQVISTVKNVRPDVVTTTSPAIAYIVKKNFPEIKTRASVNMKIGSVKGMQYLEPIFDSFCIAKECNRDLSLLKDISHYAKENGKQITILANSGCMRNCSGQIFHDNMVAHEADIAKNDNIGFVPYTCWNYLRDSKNFVSVLQNTWIRPEDIDNYEPYADLIKIATRMHSNPAMVISAYAKRKFKGNLLDLFEPGYSPAFAPYIIDSSLLPMDFWQKTTECNKKCENCNYCATVLEKSLISTDM